MAIKIGIHLACFFWRLHSAQLFLEAYVLGQLASLGFTRTLPLGPTRTCLSALLTPNYLTERLPLPDRIGAYGLLLANHSTCVWSLFDAGATLPESKLLFYAKLYEHRPAVPSASFVDIEGLSGRQHPRTPGYKVVPD